MQTYDLVPHPAFPPGKVEAVGVRWSELPDGRLMLRYRVDGCAELAVPSYRGNGRADELWKTTCFELFLLNARGHYREFNFSPSGHWAGYAFSGYRDQTGNAALRDWPRIEHDSGATIFVQTVFLPLEVLEGAERAALCAVIEEAGGRLSYWALDHAGAKPDFHHPACFAAQLAAPPAP